MIVDGNQLNHKALMVKVQDIDVVFEEADSTPEEKRRRLNNAFEILFGEINKVFLRIKKEMQLVKTKTKERETNGRKA